jgi:exodeoxyribonuclease VII small subunit
MPGFIPLPRMPKVPLPSSPASSPAAPDTGALPASYEAGLQELERLVAELESGQLPLDQLLGSYQRGAALLAFCRDKLQAVEDQIKVLDANGLKAWAEE